jgi:hypothetical protein
MSNKKINLVLSNGLLVLSGKVNRSIATLFVTDLVGTTRIVLDLDSKKLLSNRDNVELNSKDIDNLIKELNK